MRTAEAIVHRLLEQEAERVCSSCQRALGIQAQVGQSHGYCKRHALEQQQAILKMTMEKGNQKWIDLAQKKMAEIQAYPEDQFPQDLQQHAAVAQ
jgi:hypothetical protein